MCPDCLNVLRLQAGEIREDLIRSISVGQTGKYGAECDARPFEDGPSVADLSRADDASIQAVRHSKVIIRRGPLLFLFHHLASRRLRLLDDLFLKLRGHHVVVVHFHVEAAAAWVIGQVLRAETAGQGRGFSVHRRGVGVKEWAPGLHWSFQRDLVDCIRKAKKLPIYKITPVILYCGLLLLVVHIFGGH